MFEFDDLPDNQFDDLPDDQYEMADAADDQPAEPSDDLQFGALDRWGRPYWPSSGEYYYPHE